jgi:hypothetical protein
VTRSTAEAPRGRPAARSRRALVLALAGGVLAFLAVSFLFARVLSAGSDERGVAIAVIKAQARGDAGAVLALLDGCRSRPACAARVRATVARERRPGRVDVLNVRSPSFSLGARTGTTRVAWRARGGLPVVQCVTARRTGNPLAGYDIRVLALSAPIGREASC